MKMLMMLLAFPAFAADVLPLKHGVYVQDGNSCQDPASAVVMGYYGDHMAVGHDSCNFQNVVAKGRRIRVHEVCSNHQANDNSKLESDVVYTIVDRSTFVVSFKTSEKLTHQLYTYCRPKL